MSISDGQPPRAFRAAGGATSLHVVLAQLLNRTEVPTVAETCPGSAACSRRYSAPQWLATWRCARSALARVTGARRVAHNP